MNSDSLTLNYSQVRQFVIEDNGKYYPMFKAEDIDRDQFFHLRTQLIKLGCPKEDVLLIAKKMCMEVLQINCEKVYLKYILEDTYYKCNRNIDSGYENDPIQDIQNQDYSHTNLFSSIYGFEIEYLKSKGIYSGIADIGCGEGIFIKLARDRNIDVEGYEVKMPLFCHDVKIHFIDDYYDIKKPYQCLVYNHVLEHNHVRPDAYLRLVLEHFKKNVQNSNVKSILISLPMHIDIPSHLASKHHWVCNDDVFIESDLKKTFSRNSLKIYHPTLHFLDIAKDYNYKLIVKNNLGIYVFEKNEF